MKRGIAIVPGESASKENVTKLEKAGFEVVVQIGSQNIYLEEFQSVRSRTSSRRKIKGK